MPVRIPTVPAPPTPRDRAAARQETSPHRPTRGIRCTRASPCWRTARCPQSSSTLFSQTIAPTLPPCQRTSKPRLSEKPVSWWADTLAGARLVPNLRRALPAILRRLMAGIGSGTDCFALVRPECQTEVAAKKHRKRIASEPRSERTRGIREIRNYNQVGAARAPEESDLRKTPAARTIMHHSLRASRLFLYPELSRLCRDRWARRSLDLRGELQVPGSKFQVRRVTAFSSLGDSPCRSMRASPVCLFQGQSGPLSFQNLQGVLDGLHICGLGQEMAAGFHLPPHSSRNRRRKMRLKSHLVTG
jgi:hypothetical protein